LFYSEKHRNYQQLTIATGPVEPLNLRGSIHKSIILLRWRRNDKKITFPACFVKERNEYQIAILT